MLQICMIDWIALKRKVRQVHLGSVRTTTHAAAFWHEAHARTPFCKETHKTVRLRYKILLEPEPERWRHSLAAAPSLAAAAIALAACQDNLSHTPLSQSIVREVHLRKLGGAPAELGEAWRANVGEAVAKKSHDPQPDEVVAAAEEARETYTGESILRQVQFLHSSSHFL